MRKKGHNPGLNPNYLFPKKAAKSRTANLPGDSWWVGLGRAALNAEAGRRFAVNQKLGVVVNTKGVLL